MKGQPWHELQLVDEGRNGKRHYLDGRGIHAGEVIELQHIRCDDAGGESEYLQSGTVVRYEAKWLHDGADAGEIAFATLHLCYGGFEFTVRIEPWMRFRWPKRPARRGPGDVGELVELLHTSTAGDLRRAIDSLPDDARTKLRTAVVLARGGR
jgi:hypothetical protein